MAIDLIDIQKYKFGTVAWQDAMEHNIRQKIRHREDFGPVEKCFLGVQKEKYCKPQISQAAKVNVSKTPTMDAIRISAPKGVIVKPFKDTPSIYQDELLYPDGRKMHRTINKVTGDTVVEELKGKSVDW